MDLFGSSTRGHLPCEASASGTLALKATQPCLRDSLVGTGGSCRLDLPSSLIKSPELSIISRQALLGLCWDWVARYAGVWACSAVRFGHIPVSAGRQIGQGSQAL